jgi:hypothetical protein
MNRYEMIIRSKWLMDGAKRAHRALFATASACA